VDVDQVAQIRAAFIFNPQINVSFHRGQKAVPIIAQPLWPPYLDFGFQASSPSSVQKGPKFKVVIGMQMGDENHVKVAQLHALIGQSTRNTKATIDHDPLAIKAQKA
jgi:hypothetical protein